MGPSGSPRGSEQVRGTPEQTKEAAAGSSPTLFHGRGLPSPPAPLTSLRSRGWAAVPAPYPMPGEPNGGNVRGSGVSEVPLLPGRVSCKTAECQNSHLHVPRTGETRSRAPLALLSAPCSSRHDRWGCPWRPQRRGSWQRLFVGAALCWDTPEKLPE